MGRSTEVSSFRHRTGCSTHRTRARQGVLLPYSPAFYTYGPTPCFRDAEHGEALPSVVSFSKGRKYRQNSTLAESLCQGRSLFIGACP